MSSDLSSKAYWYCSNLWVIYKSIRRGAGVNSSGQGDATVFFNDKSNKTSFCVVKRNMGKAERNSIISAWGHLALREKLETNPYSLTQDELGTLKAHDGLAAKLQGLIKGVLVQKALNNSLRCKL